MDILEKRIDRFKDVISKRQYDLTIILENVHDPHNIGAVLRTCDSVGIGEIFIIYTDKVLQERGVEVGDKSSSGAKQWIDIHYFEDVASCMKIVKKKYSNIYSTKLGEDSKNLYELKLSKSCALLFGNEHKGVSAKASKYVDSNFIIPQHGFVKSLNISVACAVALYEAQRQRFKKGMYDKRYEDNISDNLLLEKYKKTHRDKKKIEKSE